MFNIQCFYEIYDYFNVGKSATNVKSWQAFCKYFQAKTCTEERNTIVLVSYLLGTNILLWVP